MGQPGFLCLIFAKFTWPFTTQKTGCTAKEYYDEEGLLPVERSSQNYRLYSDSDLERIWEILIYKEMDFELREIKQLLSLPEEQRKQKMDEQKERTRSQMSELEVQTAFISMVKNRGMPEKPNQEEKMTYVDRIEEIKRIIHEKFIK